MARVRSCPAQHEIPADLNPCRSRPDCLWNAAHSKGVILSPVRFLRNNSVLRALHFCAALAHVSFFSVNMLQFGRVFAQKAAWQPCCSIFPAAFLSWSARPSLYPRYRNGLWDVQGHRPAVCSLASDSPFFMTSKQMIQSLMWMIRAWTAAWCRGSGGCLNRRWPHKGVIVGYPHSAVIKRPFLLIKNLFTINAAPWCVRWKWTVQYTDITYNIH